jgi:predicted nucleic acid-binding Zn finger protein
MEARLALGEGGIAVRLQNNISLRFSGTVGRTSEYVVNAKFVELTFHELWRSRACYELD